MQAGDRLYYRYTDKNGTPFKIAAVVPGLEADGISIRVGRYEVHGNKRPGCSRVRTTCHDWRICRDDDS